MGSPQNLTQNSFLRRAIDDVTAIRFPAAFEDAWSKLQAETAHSIVMLPRDSQWFATFNCYAFALGIVDTDRYRNLVERESSSVMANSDFVAALLSAGDIVEVQRDDARAGDIVLYFEANQVRHGGLVLSEDLRIRSKWGAGELYDHGLWEVGASYGEQARFFHAPDPAKVLDLLEAWLSR